MMKKRVLQFASIAILAASAAFAGTPPPSMPPTPAPKPCSSFSIKSCGRIPIPPIHSVKR
jgi:hypothetical protein